MRMRNIMCLAAAATLSFAALNVSRSEAAVLGPAALGAAIAGLEPGAAEPVHCRPGWQHHRWRYGEPTWDGCAAVVVPGIGLHHHHHHHHHRRHHHHHHRHGHHGGGHHHRGGHHR